MHFLRRNKILFFLPVILFFIMYLDKSVLLWIKNYYAGNADAQHIDHAIRPPIRILSHGVTLFGVSLGLYLFTGSFNRRLRDAGKSLFIALCVSGVAVQILKHLFGRARPSLTFDTLFIGPSVKYGYDSFPSGHTTMAFCFAFILSEYYPKYRLAFYLFAVIVGLYRVDGLSHFPSDVLAGALLGSVVGKIATIKLSAQAQQAPGEGASRQSQ
jgi:undecaprenyl-diphosphatase